jgi:sulfate permease, SulP family
LADPIQYSSQGVREQTQELASWALGESSPRGRVLSDSDGESRGRGESVFSDLERTSFESSRPEVIEEEEYSPQESTTTMKATSGLSDLFRPKKQPLPRTSFTSRAKAPRPEDHPPPDVTVEDVETGEVSETTALLSPRNTRESRDGDYGSHAYRHSWKPHKGMWISFRKSAMSSWDELRRPNRWDIPAMFHSGVGAVSAVTLGLLLNVLDALSYGMILFPLGVDIFEKTGPDGISMFYVSCIVSQLTFSLGGTAFQGGVGSEMIEVVPFFHKMAYMILDEIGTKDPEAVLATVITSYAVSSILTGVVFLLLGALRLGDLVSFFPRSILLGCIGGVGVFLFLTGIEVSAGMDSSIEWGLDTFERLFIPATFVLWVIPLALSGTLMLVRKYFRHPVVMPAFFILVVAIFYIVLALIPNLGLDDLRKTGWVFAAPEAGVPFYNFYTYYSELISPYHCRRS